MTVAHGRRRIIGLSQSSGRKPGPSTCPRMGSCPSMLSIYGSGQRKLTKFSTAFRSLPLSSSESSRFLSGHGVPRRRWLGRRSCLQQRAFFESLPAGHVAASLARSRLITYGSASDRGAGLVLGAKHRTPTDSGIDSADFSNSSATAARQGNSLGKGNGRSFSEDLPIFDDSACSFNLPNLIGCLSSPAPQLSWRIMHHLSP